MQDKSQNDKRIAKNTLFLYFRMMLIMGITLYTSRVVLHAMGVVDYGVYNVVGGVVAMFSFLNTALAQATERYIAISIGKETVEQQRNTFSMLLNVHILIALVLFVFSEVVGVWLLYNKLVIPADRLASAFWVMQCSILTMMISVTQVPYNASIFGHEKMGIYAYISIAEALLKLLAVILLKFLFTDKLLAYGIMIMIVQIIIAFSYRMYCMKSFNNCQYHRCWQKELFKGIFGYTSWSLIGNVAWTLNNQGMNFLVNIFFGPAFNAARGIAMAVQSAVASFTTNFLGASVPQIIKSYAVGDIEYMTKLCIRSGKFGFLLFMCIALPLICGIQAVLKIWLVNPPYMTSAFCVFSLLQVMISTFGGTLQNVVQATGRVKTFQLANGCLQLLAVPIAYILYKLGAPVLTYIYVLMVITALSIYVQLWAVRREIKEFSIKKYALEVVCRALVALVVPLIIALYFSVGTYTLWQSVLYVLAVFILCLLSSWFLAFKSNERKWFRDIIENKIKK